MVNADRTPIDKRALILRWIEEQEALCQAATPGPWWPGPYYKSDVMSRTGRVGETGIMRGDQGIVDARLFAASRSVLPLALAALRAEVEAHKEQAHVMDGEPLGYCGQCDGDGWPCPTIDRLFCSLGLQDSGR